MMTEFKRKGMAFKTVPASGAKCTGCAAHKGQGKTNAETGEFEPAPEPVIKCDDMPHCTSQMRRDKAEVIFKLVKGKVTK